MPMDKHDMPVMEELTIMHAPIKEEAAHFLKQMGDQLTFV
jgi:hypothetical protein